MLVELAKLPVHREDVHVVVLLKVQSQQIQSVVTSLQTLLILKDLLHLGTKYTFLKTYCISEVTMHLLKSKHFYFTSWFIFLNNPICIHPGTFSSEIWTSLHTLSSLITII